MSYSNDWHISGVSGLTSLKDCYQWNGVKRLHDFGMLRLRDDDVIKGTNSISVITSKFPLYVNSNNVITNSTNHGKSYYYKIPHFLIQNKNLCAIGTPTFSDTENAYNSSQLDYVGSSASNAKNWRFRLYPSILSFAENFSHLSRDNCSISSVRLFDYGYYEASGKWVGQVKDDPSNTRFLIASYSSVIDGGSDSYANVRWDRTSESTSPATDWEEWTATFYFYYNVSSTSISFTDLTQATFSNDYLRDAIFWKNNFYFTDFDSGYGEGKIKPSAQADFVGSKTTQESSLIVNGFCWLPYYTSIIDGLQTSISCGVRPNGINAGLSNTITLNFHTSNVYDSVISTLTFSASGSRWSSADYDTDNYKIRLHMQYGPFAGRIYSFGSMSSWYNLNWTNSSYTCPIILSNEPALIFERLTDSRNNDSYCYKVYQGADVANVSNTGGSIQVYFYIDDAVESRTLILNSDSGTASTQLSNGGHVYWYGPSSGQVVDGCIVYEQPGATSGSWEGFGPHVKLYSQPFIPTYYSASAGGGMYRYFGWRGSNNFTLYGKLTNYINIDGRIAKYEDSSAHSFTYSSPIYDSVRVQDPISGDEHTATLVYSELQWGYSSDQLSYTQTRGTLPIKTLVITSENNGLGTLTYSWNGTSTTVQAENGNVTIVLNGEDLPQTFTITNVSPKEGYGYTGSIASYYWTFNNLDTFYLDIDGFNVADFSHVYILENFHDGGSSDPDYYSIDVTNESGYLISYTGFFYKWVNNVPVRSQCSDSNVRNLSTITYVDSLSELEYAEIVYTNGSQSRTLTYGTAPRELSITNHVLWNNSNYNPKNYEWDGNQKYAEYYEVSSLPGDWTGLLINFNGTDYYLSRTSNRFLEYQYYYDYEYGRSIWYKLVFDTAINRIFVTEYDSGDPAESDWDSDGYGSGFTISKVTAIR